MEITSYMNYQKIHDSIINRARNRTTLLENVNYHKHHVHPIHEGGDVKGETVVVTIKEHYVIHHLRHKITGTLGNKLAWLLTKGNIDNDTYLITSEAGKIGGAVTKSNGLGIFSPEYNRSAQTKLNWTNGTMEHIDFSSVGKVGGSACRDMKAGMFREDLRHLRTEWAKIGAKALEESGNRSGIYNKEWRENNPEIVLENASKGGKKGGKTTGSMFWWNNGTVNKKAFECPDDGWVRGMLMSEKKKAQVYNQFKSKIKCVHCNREFSLGNYKQAHGDKCKLNANK